MRGLTLADPALVAQQLSGPAARRNYLLDLTASDYDQVGVQRITSTRYQLFQKIAASKFWLVEIGQSGSNPIMEILYHSIGQLRFSIDDAAGLGDVTGVNETDAQVTRSGIWTTGTNASAYGGDYKFASIAGAWTQFTPSGNCETMGLYAFKASNGGIAEATIDGSSSLCNLLPTGQDLVDAGIVPSLTGLSASKRYVVFYNATSLPNVDVPVANGLTSGSHTLRLTATGVTPTGSSGTRTYDAGWYSGATAVPATVSHVGSFSTGTQASAYGGGYRYATAAGAKVKIEIEDVVDFGVRTVRAANGGIAIVKVDGSQTAATALPTGQDLVDAGDMSSLYLTTFGGPIPPNARVLDHYRNNTLYDDGVQIVDGLSPGPHTIEIICTTARNVSASSNRLYSSGYTYAPESIDFNDAGAGIVAVREILAEPSAAEYAYNFGPVGSGVHQFIGNIHGSDIPISFDVEVDGSPVTLADGDVEVGTEVVIHRVSELRYPTTGTTKYCDVDLTYTVTRDGMAIAHTDTWTQNVVMYDALPAMFTVTQETFTKANVVGDNDVYTMNPSNTSDIPYGRLESDCAVMWEGAAGGDAVALLYARDIPDMVEGWAYTDDNLWVQDRAGPKFTKTYLSRNTDVRTISAGTVWTSDALYRVALVDDVNSLVAP